MGTINIVPRAQRQAPNNPATGAPTITGTVRVGETLTAATTGIADADGLTGVSYSYQWVAGDTDISGATASAYTLVAANAGETIKVRVTFTDDDGNEESLTSAPTAAVAAAGLEVESATVDGTALTLTYNETLDDGVTLPAAAFTVSVNGKSRSVSAASVSGSAVTLTLGSAVAAGDTVTVSYTRPSGPNFIRDTRGRSADSFSALSVTNSTAGSKKAVENTGPAALTASVHGAPSSHGSAAFTFELHFTETPADGFSYRTLRDHALTVTGGAVTGASRKDSGSNLKWIITVKPSGNGDVTVSLPATTDCDAQGAVCAADGRMLSGAVEFTIPEQEPLSEVQESQDETSNSPATGAPAITGTARVGETLSADTSGIDDANGTYAIMFAYQWLADDADISGATGETYTLVAADEGKAIKVRVSFADDRDNAETVTSAATTAVAASSPPVDDNEDEEEAQRQATPLTASVHAAPGSHDGSSTFTFELHFTETPADGFSYRTLRDHPFTVTGGEVTGASRKDQGSNLKWVITVRPSGNGDVAVVLPVTTDCAAQGAICTADGRMLSERVELTVSGPDG